MSLIGRFLKGLMGRGEEPAETGFIYVMLPEGIGPEAREARYGDPIDAELRVARIGYVSGGGQLLSAPDENGERAIEYCGIDVDTTDVDAARELLQTHLPELGCPVGTAIEYERGEVHLRDEFDGEVWHLARPWPTVEH
jgi:hypothetical protein